MGWKNRKTNWYEAVSAARNFPFLKEISQNCFVFDVVNFEKMKKSRRIASFLTLPSSNIEEVSQTCCVFDVSSSKPEDVSQNRLEKDGGLDRTAGDIRQDFNGYTDE